MRKEDINVVKLHGNKNAENSKGCRQNMLISGMEIKCTSKVWSDKNYLSNFKFDIQVGNIKYQK